MTVLRPVGQDIAPEEKKNPSKQNKTLFYMHDENLILLLPIEAKMTCI